MRYTCLLLLLLCSCTTRAAKLSCVHLTTQKGLTQTIKSPERLHPFEDENYLLHQPHLKVVRVYEGKESSKTIVTTYYPSGHLFQLLECKNNQANGRYEEWNSNGMPKVKARVIGGSPDISSNDLSTWIFDGPSLAFDEEGRLIARFNYSSGMLEGESSLYYPDGTLKESLYYVNGLLNGERVRYNIDGVIIEKNLYKMGLKEGESTLYWSKKALASQEKYVNGKLHFGLYFDRMGKLIGRVKDGNGYKIVWNDDLSYQSFEYRMGEAQGMICEYDESGNLTHSYFVENELKQGEEVFYFPSSPVPRLSIFWQDGEVHGSVRSWYPNGMVESEREVSHNKKQGLLTAKYESGNVMLIEEYDQDLLIKGHYFEEGSQAPVSSVLAGEGLATIYDRRGLIAKKVRYSGGRPVE